MKSLKSVAEKTYALLEEKGLDPKNMDPKVVTAVMTATIVAMDFVVTSDDQIAERWRPPGQTSHYLRGGRRRK